VADNAITNDKMVDDAINTLEIVDDAVTAAKINGDVAGTGLIQAADGSLEVDPATITGDGDLSSTDGTIDITGTSTGALFEDIDIDVADNSITSDKIADGTITNDDISGTAAIAGTKINPNFGANNVETTGDFISNGVTLNVPDYVFEMYFEGFSNLNDNYRFTSLKEIEEYVIKHKHLPGIKSAHEIKEANEYRLTESSLSHLEKIEELFLHTIEQEKKIEKLNSENQKLSNELDALRSEMQLIKELLMKEDE
ncbi:MAG: hypothetical protein AAFY00_06085, partial [Bacteroidota bacterium]